MKSAINITEEKDSFPLAASQSAGAGDDQQRR